jgi:hypothetical protein
MLACTSPVPKVVAERLCHAFGGGVRGIDTEDYTSPVDRLSLNSDEGLFSFSLDEGELQTDHFSLRVANAV